MTEVKLSKWWRTRNAKAALRRSEKVKADRLKLLRKLAQSKKHSEKKCFDNAKQDGKMNK